MSSEMKAKDKTHVSEDQVVQTAKDSDCMIVLGGRKKKGKIYLCAFLREGTILARIQQ